MYKTKLTKKGQVTIPCQYRERLHLNTGTVLVVEMKKNKIMIEKPKMNIENLFGAWKNLNDETLKEIKKAWTGWNEKSISKL